MRMAKEELLNILALLEGVLVALAIGFGWNLVLLDFALRHPMVGPTLYGLCVLFSGAAYVKLRLG